MKFENLSIIVPTLNVRHLIEPIADQMREVFAEAGEVIVVDSYSKDGTLEFLEELLDFDHATFHLRPRGLYASWNYGIQRSSKKWIHIATAGDILSLGDLDYLHGIAEEKDVDVVCSAPNFYSESGERLADRSWPVHDLFERHEDSEIIELSGKELVAFALTHCRPGKYHGWLGSSASNLYRAALLEEKPFPRDVGPIGDSLWGLQQANAVSVCFCRRRCGRFVIHESARPFLPDAETAGIFSKVWSDLGREILSEFDSATAEGETLNFVQSLIETEVQLGEQSRRFRMRIRRLLEQREHYSDYIFESRKRIPRCLKSLFLPGLKRGEFTLSAVPLEIPGVKAGKDESPAAISKKPTGNRKNYR